MDQLLLSSIPLVVKSTAQNIADHRIDAKGDWTIAHLKDFLQGNHPNQPLSDGQKLIYSGRLLADHMLLRDVFRHVQEGEIHTLHLVCDRYRQLLEDGEELRYRGFHHQTNQQQKVRDDNDKFEEPQEMQDRVMPDISTLYPPEYVDMVNQLYAHYWQQVTSSLSTNQLWWQKAGLGNTSSVAPPSNTSTSPTPPAQPAPHQAPAAARDNIVLDAQGRPMQLDDDDDGNDWLDWSYLVLRLFVVLSILYFYSSLGRFLLVGAICALICVVYVVRRDWQVERGGARPPRQQQPAQQEQPAAQQQEQQQPVAQQQAEPQPAEQPQQPVSILQTIQVFVYNFFASLVPQMPQAV